jgi:demethylmenaquinone methyltransferase/2-methoxy-6-polyprenyl-1,4-benzoquinol methylase
LGFGNRHTGKGPSRHLICIKAGAEALKHGARFVILDIKKPGNVPTWSIRLGAWVMSPFGVSLELAERHPWEPIRRYRTNTSFTELYFGFAYISAGQAPPKGA